LEKSCRKIVHDLFRGATSTEEKWRHDVFWYHRLQRRLLSGSSLQVSLDPSAVHANQFVVTSARSAPARARIVKFCLWNIYIYILREVLNSEHIMFWGGTRWVTCLKHVHHVHGMFRQFAACFRVLKM
jgi:hypothetical protein